MDEATEISTDLAIRDLERALLLLRAAKVAAPHLFGGLLQQAAAVTNGAGRNLQSAVEKLP